jgi:Lon protease-like protein
MTEHSKPFRKETPMFPLGSVLFPGATLPLNIFEGRYRSLAQRCVGNEEPFGVVLIEKGHEVGGGDVRSSVGCLARILEHREFPDGRWALLVRGESRILVDEWLDDDPYPKAVITDFPDDDSELSMDRSMKVLQRLTTLTVNAKSAGYEVPIIDPEALAVGVDVQELGYRIAQLTPSGSFDRQRILTRSNCADRLNYIEELVVGLEEVVEATRGKK